MGVDSMLIWENKLYESAIYCKCEILGECVPHKCSFYRINWQQNNIEGMWCLWWDVLSFAVNEATGRKSPSFRQLAPTSDPRKLRNGRTLQFDLGQKAQRTPLPASSKWPFDSPIEGHLSPDKVTYCFKRGHFEEPGERDFWLVCFSVFGEGFLVSTQY